MEYAPIHNHSEYSALDGLSTCREIAERCQELGVGHVGITDHGTVSGHLEFDKVMREHNIKPIFGCELYHGVKTEWTKNERDQAHFVAGAMTDKGLRNLWTLVDLASENFRYVGRVNWDLLREYSEGVFATSACIQGLVSQGVVNGDTNALNKYLDIFGENFYIELHTYPATDQEAINLELTSLAKERGIPVIYATDAHFASPDQYDIHDAYIAMQTGDSKLTPIEDRKMWHPKVLYIQGEDEIRKNLSYLPESVVEEALINSGELAAKCDAKLPEIKRHLPAFIPNKSPWVEKENRELSAAEILLQEVEKGLKALYGHGGTIPQEVGDRAATEIEVFLEAGLEHYFLQAWDFVQFCEKEEIRRGPGRGSAAGSIVAYALGITDIDPLEHDLIFERFYNPGREKGFPDIDCDFPTKDRDRVKKYMETRWGKDKVRSIGTITRMKPKAAIEKTYKVCGISFERMDQLKKLVDEVPDIDILGADSIGWDSDIDPGKTIYVMHSTPQAEHNTGAEILKWVQGLPDSEQGSVLGWLDLLRVVCSRISGYGIHPSGVVVSDVALSDELPCMWNANQKTQVTCFPMSDVDKRQFVKDDFLGLANLDILDEWEDQVVPLIGEEINWKAAEHDHDPAMWKLLEKGLTRGIFQIEEGYARHLCKEFKPKSIEDLSIIVALNRPGPIRSGAPDSFLKRRNGEEEVTYDHPILEPILNNTYGWFLFQEQVINFFSALGYSLSDADAVRKILGKKKPEDMKALHEGTGEWKGKGYTDIALLQLGDAAQVIWNKIEDFAKYSFNKSHAIAYAVVGFRTLYAKFNSPAHFFIGCIRVATRQKKSKEDIGKYVSEARRMGIAVLPPDIDHSMADIEMRDNRIYFGFMNIKGIGKGAAEFMCTLRDKYTLVSPESVHEAIEQEQSLWELEKKTRIAAGEVFKKKSPRSNFPKNRIPPLHQAGAFIAKSEEPEFSLKELQKLQKELLGVIVTDNCEEILSQNWEEIDRCGTYEELLHGDLGERVFVPGIVSTVVPKKTRRDGKAMGIVTIEYQGEQAEFVVFPKEWRSFRFLWSERTPAIFALCRTDRGIRFEEAIKLT